MRIIGITTHRGSYGGEFMVDENGDPLVKKEPEKKRLGRPKKNESSSDIRFSIDDELYTWALKRHFLTP